MTLKKVNIDLCRKLITIVTTQKVMTIQGRDYDILVNRVIPNYNGRLRDVLIPYLQNYLRQRNIG